MEIANAKLLLIDNINKLAIEYGDLSSNYRAILHAFINSRLDLLHLIARLEYFLTIIYELGYELLNKSMIYLHVHSNKLLIFTKSPSSKERKL